jgi:hypothetical protein
MTDTITKPLKTICFKYTLCAGCQACGLRPSEGTGSAGALAATERHLKDMQRLVFKDKK